MYSFVIVYILVILLRMSWSHLPHRGKEDPGGRILILFDICMLFLRILLRLTTFFLPPEKSFEPWTPGCDTIQGTQRNNGGYIGSTRKILGGWVLVVIRVCLFRSSFWTWRIGFLTFTLWITIFCKNRYGRDEVDLWFLFWHVEENP